MQRIEQQPKEVRIAYALDQLKAIIIDANTEDEARMKCEEKLRELVSGKILPNSQDDFLPIVSSVRDLIREEFTLKVEVAGFDPLFREDIEYQNIMFMLGLSASPEDFKDEFLDYLSEQVWIEFMAKKVELLLDPSQIDYLNSLRQKGDGPQVREELLVYLDSVIPNLEDAMMELSLEIKIRKVTDELELLKIKVFDPDILEKIKTIESLIQDGKWGTAGKMLNELFTMYPIDLYKEGEQISYGIDFWYEDGKVRYPGDIPIYSSSKWKVGPSGLLIPKKWPKNEE